MRKIFSIFALVAMVCVFMACSGEQATGIAAMVEEGTVVARVGDLDIMAGDVAFMKQEASFMLQWDFDREIDDWEHAVLEDATRLAALLVVLENYAVQNNIALTAEDHAGIEETVQMTIDDLGEDFEETLAEHNIFGRRHLARYFEVFELMGRTIQTIVETPALFAEFEHLMEPEFVPDQDEEVIGVKHILIMREDFETEEEAMEFAMGIYARAVAGEDFDSLIITYGNDPGMMRNYPDRYPDGYFFTMGAFNNPPFEDASAALAIGEIGEPLDASHGLHIIKRISPDENLTPDDIMRPGGLPPTYEERQIAAIYTAFEAKIEAANIVFLPALYEMVEREEGWEQLQVVQ
ncbi:MAG: peptidylprolyl isomerase [Defluviitaleaceae bacterium]|nr:peptidylprolyl isomerase [Defluviitaleaceae bacterium]